METDIKMDNKKKILLVTLFDDNNIGNRLQNYALQHTLELHNVNVSIIDNGYTNYPTIKFKIKVLIKRCLGIVGIEKYRYSFQQYLSCKAKRIANEEFDKNNIHNIIKLSNEKIFNKNLSNFDIAIAGSDQIWHKWGTDKLELPFYYLEFMPIEKRAAYAASFGFEEFPEKDLEQHKNGLRNMRYISCRELSGCKLVSEAVGRNVPRVLDPTLLLSATDWRKIEEQSSEFARSQKNYAFVYFLGAQTVEYKKKIRDVMQTQKIEEIIDFSNYMDKNISKCGPSEFLSLIDHAEWVFTDSFHCTVFSVIFDKKFTVFRRKQEGHEKMFGRIEDLLASTNKLEHIYGGTTRGATNDFDKLYSDSLNYIDRIIKSTDIE